MPKAEYYPVDETVKRNSQDNRYVLLRSFEERERHLEELEIFQEKLPHDFARTYFLPDPLSTQIPSYRANLPPYVRKWVQGRREVVNISEYRHSSGIDQVEEAASKGEYVPNRYTVLCRNKEELENHLDALQIYAESSGAREKLELHCVHRFLKDKGGYLSTLTPSSTYTATLDPELLEWVKRRDEVIHIVPDPVQGYGDVEPRCADNAADAATAKDEKTEDKGKNTAEEKAAAEKAAAEKAANKIMNYLPTRGSRRAQAEETAREN
ncbi:hypothetical protein B0H11DRAFT_2244005 [Mycena galericulata]|nr:hypothetical protein B0H11DRAFT_2244005 [Mycena galericulata]